jgi:Zn-dependent M32 family carboxypeptidase
MKSEQEFRELINTVEQQEHQAEAEMRHIRELERQLHIAESLPKTMSADGPTFSPLPTKK